jgi:hypothetical protein
VLTPPSRAARPIFTDHNSEPHAGATVAIIAALTQLQHAITQFIARYASPSWLRGNFDRGGSRRRAIFRRNHNPRSFPTLLVTTLIVVIVAARPWLALCSNDCASRTADDRANGCPAPTAQCSP